MYFKFNHDRWFLSCNILIQSWNSVSHLIYLFSNLKCNPTCPVQFAFNSSNCELSACITLNVNSAVYTKPARHLCAFKYLWTKVTFASYGDGQTFLNVSFLCLVVRPSEYLLSLHHIFSVLCSCMFCADSAYEDC